MRKTVLVTGSTDGIGRETAIALARRGVDVILHGRHTRRAAAVRRELAEITGRRPPEPLLADFSSLQGVAGLTAILDARGLRLDVLVNNAAAAFPERRVNDQGYELTLAVNHLAPFLLTHSVLASRCGATLERIVNVSSMAQRNGVIDLDDLHWRKRDYTSYAAYAATKLANVMMTLELARRLRPRGVCVNALHPGVVTTTLLKEGLGGSGWESAAQASSTSVWLALSADAGKHTGCYFSDGRPAPMNLAAHDGALVSAFYQRSLELSGAASA